MHRKRKADSEPLRDCASTGDAKSTGLLSDVAELRVSSMPDRLQCRWQGKRQAVCFGLLICGCQGRYSAYKRKSR